jgi:hypothetical protein
MFSPYLLLSYFYLQTCSLLIVFFKFVVLFILVPSLLFYFYLFSNYCSLYTCFLCTLHTYISLLLPSKLFPPHHFHNHKPCYSPPVYRNRTSSPPQSCPIHTPANNRMPRKTNISGSFIHEEQKVTAREPEDFRIGPLYALISVVNIRLTFLTLSVCHSLSNTAHLYLIG